MPVPRQARSLWLEAALKRPSTPFSFCPWSFHKYLCILCCRTGRLLPCTAWICRSQNNACDLEWKMHLLPFHACALTCLSPLQSADSGYGLPLNILMITLAQEFPQKRGFNSSCTYNPPCSLFKKDIFPYRMLRKGETNGKHSNIFRYRCTWV